MKKAVFYLFIITLVFYGNASGQVRKVDDVEVKNKMLDAEKLVLADSQGCIREARKIYQQLLKDGSFQPGNLDEAYLYERLGYTSYRLVGGGSRREILKLYQTALSIYSKAPNKISKLRRARTFYYMGLILGIKYNSVKEREQALSYFLKGLNMVKALPEQEAKEIQADILIGLGNHYYYTGKENFVLALKYDKEALILCKQLGDFDRQSKTMVKIGFDQFAMTRNINNVLGYFEKSLELSRQWSDKKAQAIILQGFGNFYSKLNNLGMGDKNYNLEKGEKYYNEALDICRSINDRVLEEDLMSDFASLYFDVDREKRAKYLELSDKLEEELKRECNILVK